MPGERVVVRVDRSLDAEFLALDGEAVAAAKPRLVAHLQELSPYGMLLASLGACTGIVLHTYASHHGLVLERVELRLRYDRVFAKDCVDCDKTTVYEDEVDLEIALEGRLGPEDSQRLFLVSQHCPIHKMLADGVPIRARLADAPSRKSPGRGGRKETGPSG